MYNGIGLTTPRGSGTNGYVVRNLSTLRSYQSSQDRQAAWDAAPPKYREPDQAILEHEQMRKVEVKCLELQLEFEEKEMDEALIEEQVSALRSKLLASLPQHSVKKPTDTHAMAAAKKEELSKMARALGTRVDYQEGEAFDREKQEELRLKRLVEREERNRQKEEDRTRMAAQKAKWEEERKERDRLRRREEDSMRREREQAGGRLGRRNDRDQDLMPPPPRRDFRDRPNRQSLNPRLRRSPPRSRSRSPPRRRFPRPPSPDARARQRHSPPLRESSLSPPPRRVGLPRRGARPDSRSPSPRHDSRSPSPRGRASPPHRPRVSRSPSPRGRRISRSLSRSASRSLSRSPPHAPLHRRKDTPSPPPRGRSRSRSVVSTGSSMSVSDRSRSRD